MTMSAKEYWSSREYFWMDAVIRNRSRELFHLNFPAIINEILWFAVHFTFQSAKCDNSFTMDFIWMLVWMINNLTENVREKKRFSQCSMPLQLLKSRKQRHHNTKENIEWIFLWKILGNRINFVSCLLYPFSTLYFVYFLHLLFSLLSLAPTKRA